MRYVFQLAIVATMFVGPVLLADSNPVANQVAMNQAALRRPVAMVLSADQATLFVANRRSGTVSMLDCRSNKIVGESKVATQLSDLVSTADGSHLLATDEAAGELLWLESAGEIVKVKKRIKVAPYPVSAAPMRDNRHVFVASLWPRQLTRVDLESGEQETLDLPFAPREQLLVRDDRWLIVADAFGGRLAVVDANEFTLNQTVEFPAHNIRGLDTSADGSMLVVAHQMLNELAHTIRNDVHWGLLMSNDLRWLRLESVLAGADDLYAGALMHPLGEPNRGTADPSGVVMTVRGEVVVTLGGVNEIAYGKETDFSMQRMKVGRRPTAVVASNDGHWIYVANTFDDSVSIIEMDHYKRVANISLGPSPELSLADRGELLFHDGRLSHDGWMTCQSCHIDGHTNGLTNDNFSDASFGAPKRVLSLLSNTDTAPFAWNASADSLGQQIRKSIEQTMQSEQPPTDQQVAAIEAYLHTLKLPESIDVLRGRVDRDAIHRGAKLFKSLECATCHTPPTFTSPAVYDVGLTDQLGRNEFNPPSLRAVGHRGPYFHDGRAATLRAVFVEHGHQLPQPLTDGELDDLTAFLRSL